MIGITEEALARIKLRCMFGSGGLPSQNIVLCSRKYGEVVLWNHETGEVNTVKLVYEPVMVYVDEMRISNVK